MAAAGFTMAGEDHAGDVLVQETQWEVGQSDT